MYLDIHIMFIIKLNIYYFAKIALWIFAFKDLYITNDFRKVVAITKF